jgi:hypothetical protein
MQEIVEEKNRHNLGVSDDFSDAYGEEEIVQEVEDSHNYFAESPVAHTIQERANMEAGGGKSQQSSAAGEESCDMYIESLNTVKIGLHPHGDE